jgi:signal transduction histidine kinase
MKLWQKLSLICTMVLLIIVGVCSTILLLSSRSTILELTTGQALSEQKNLQTSFAGMVAYYGKDDAEAPVKHSLLLYSFKRFAGDTSVLASENETLYSNLSFSPVELLRISNLDEQVTYSGRIEGQDILIVGSKTLILSDPYYIYTVHDISSVSKSIADMVLRFSIVSVFCIAVGIALITVLVRYAIRPLKSLSHTAGRIAKGYYNERAEILSRDEVGTLSKDFNAMAQAVEYHIEELTESTQKQQMFIGALTHEFKTPLTSVIGHSETLLTTDMSAEVVENSLMHIHEQCKWLERLTQKLLKLITLEEEIRLRDEDVSELLDTVKNSLDETLRNRQINLEIACEIKSLPMDNDLMQSLLINLIDNAAKASPEQGTISIHAYDKTIEVKDYGIGIPQSEMPRITEPFYRVDKSRSKQLGGSGLGLALAKRIADAHGARLTVESVLDIGTTVRVQFPHNKTFTS